MKPVLNIVSVITLASVFAIHSVLQDSRFDFASPTNLGSTLNTSRFDGGPSISPDGLNLYFTSDRGGGSGGGDLWVAKRAKPSDPFGVPENLGQSLNSPANEFAPSVSANGLSIYSTRIGPAVWVHSTSGWRRAQQLRFRSRHRVTSVPR